MAALINTIVLSKFFAVVMMLLWNTEQLMCVFRSCKWTRLQSWLPSDDGCFAPRRLRCAYSCVHMDSSSSSSLSITLKLSHATVEHTHTRPFNGPFSGTTQVSRYQKGKTNLDFTEARNGEWKWHQLGHMQVCILLQTDNHTSTPPLSFLQARCPSCRPTNSVKALKTLTTTTRRK